VVKNLIWLVEVREVLLILFIFPREKIQQVSFLERRE